MLAMKVTDNTKQRSFFKCSSIAVLRSGLAMAARLLRADIAKVSHEQPTLTPANILRLVILWTI